MSKDQKETVNIPVETVEKIDHMLNWISTTITFWKLYDQWPTNFIKDIIDELINILQKTLSNRCVS